MNSLEEILNPPKIGRPRTRKMSSEPTIGGIPLKEYRKLYYERNKKASAKEKKQLNPLGKTTLVYLRSRGYSFTAIKQVIPRSVPWLSKKYNELSSQDYINTPEYAQHLPYLNSGADLIGPLDLSRCCFSTLEDRITIQITPKAEQPQL